MNWEQTIDFQPMREEAAREFGRLTGQLDRTRSNLESRMNGNSTAAILGGILLSILYLAAYLYLYGLGRTRIGIPYLALGALISGAALILTMVLDSLIRLGYYGGIQRHLDQINRLIAGLKKSESALDKDLGDYSVADLRNWDLSLNGKESISGQAERIESAVSGMESLHRGFLNGLKNVLYYVTCLVWAAAGSLALFEIARRFVDVSQGWLYAGAGAACVAEILLARLLWSKTGCEVRSLTVLATFAGPLLFALVIALGALVVGLVTAALYIIGVIIVGAIFFGMCSGG